MTEQSSNWHEDHAGQFLQQANEDRQAIDALRRRSKILAASSVTLFIAGLISGAYASSAWGPLAGGIVAFACGALGMTAIYWSRDYSDRAYTLLRFAAACLPYSFPRGSVSK